MMPAEQSIELSFCVVNTEKRDLLLRCLDAIGDERAHIPLRTETIGLDNASDDGSAQAAAEHHAVDRVIALSRRSGKARNDSRLLMAAQGDFALLLNEDSQLMPGATLALYDEMKVRPGAALAGAALLDPEGRPRPCAWRRSLPTRPRRGPVPTWPRWWPGATPMDDRRVVSKSAWPKKHRGIRWPRWRS